MAALNKFHDFVEELLKGTHSFTSDTFKLMLSASAPSSAADAVKADVSEIVVGGGYTAGGQVLTCTLSRVSGVAKVVIADETFTGTSGPMADFRYGVIYNDTSASKNLVAWFDHGSLITLATGDTYVADFDGVNGAFTLA